jgi:hypothetical protein
MTARMLLTSIYDHTTFLCSCIYTVIEHDRDHCRIINVQWVTMVGDAKRMIKQTREGGDESEHIYIED